MGNLQKGIGGALKNLEMGFQATSSDLGSGLLAVEVIKNSRKLTKNSFHD